MPFTNRLNDVALISRNKETTSADQALGEPLPLSELFKCPIVEICKPAPNFAGKDNMGRIELNRLSSQGGRVIKSPPVKLIGTGYLPKPL